MKRSAPPGLRAGPPRPHSVVRLGVTPVDANSGAPWSEADISDLKNELDHGRTIAETASFLCRDVYEVRATMKELGLTEQPGKRRVVL